LDVLLQPCAGRIGNPAGVLVVCTETTDAVMYYRFPIMHRNAIEDAFDEIEILVFPVSLPPSICSRPSIGYK